MIALLVNTTAAAVLQAAASVPALESGAPAAAAGALPTIVIGFWVFLLAIFVGFELITKVPPTLHTPLMSGANAISGITIVGALYCAGTGYPWAGKLLGFLAITMAMVNVVGGFAVTDRMLRMFGSRQRKPQSGE